MSAPEETPAESAPEKPSDVGEDSASEDAADAGGEGSISGWRIKIPHATQCGAKNKIQNTCLSSSIYTANIF